jgi:hypothetical protein
VQDVVFSGGHHRMPFYGAIYILLFFGLFLCRTDHTENNGKGGIWKGDNF